MNKVTLLGRLTKDPELKYTAANNTAVCTFTIAVDRRFVRQGEERQADFIQCVAWRNNAEFISKYFTKGKMIAVAGSIQTRTYDDQEGKRHYITEVVVDETYFAESKRDNETNRFAPNFGTEPPVGSSQGIEGFVPIEGDDDLPF